MHKEQGTGADAARRVQDEVLAAAALKRRAEEMLLVARERLKRTRRVCAREVGHRWARLPRDPGDHTWYECGLCGTKTMVLPVEEESGALVVGERMRRVTTDDSDGRTSC